MKQWIPWRQLLTEQVNVTSASYMTFSQFYEIIGKILQHPHCPLEGLQYLIECPEPFHSFKVGRSGTGEPDVASSKVEDSRDTFIRIRKWNKKPAVSQPENTDTLLKELIVNFWKPELRTESAGMLDLKRSSKAVTLACKTIDLANAIGNPCAVLFCDLDNFKKVNDTISVSRQQKWHSLTPLVRGDLQVFSCMQENT